jgi:hypothetical protein
VLAPSHGELLLKLALCRLDVDVICHRLAPKHFEDGVLRAQILHQGNHACIAELTRICEGEVCRQVFARKVALLGTVVSTSPVLFVVPA